MEVAESGKVVLPPAVARQRRPARGWLAAAPADTFVTAHSYFVLRTSYFPMRPIPPGTAAEVRVVVDETMLAAFEGRVVHPVYGTAAMVAHLELAGRTIILPYLEEGEEGVGYAIAVTHLAPTLPGMTVTARATFRETRGRLVVCDVAAYNAWGTIGEGSFTQAIVRRASLDARLAELRARVAAEDEG